MAQVTITINSREYAVACEDGQEGRILQLARILDEKAKMLTAGGLQVNENMLLAMVGLLVADELSELKKGPPLWWRILMPPHLLKLVPPMRLWPSKLFFWRIK